MADLRTVFVVEDEIENLELMVRTLGRKFNVKSFSNPYEALHAAQQSPPEVIITDHRMPHMTGVELIRQMRAVNINCPALMVTAFPDLDEVIVAEKQKLLFRLIAKPWNSEELVIHTELALEEPPSHG